MLPIKYAGKVLIYVIGDPVDDLLPAFIGCQENTGGREFMALVDATDWMECWDYSKGFDMCEECRVLGF